MADEAAEAKRNDLNMNVELWKTKFLYPFGNIAPISDKGVDDIATQDDQTDDLTSNSFKRLVSKKYLFPIEKIIKQEWLKEL
jgi:hypothetical protein